MSVLIRGMEMPFCCKECIMWNNESSLYGGCLAVSEREGIFDGKTNMEVRQPYCPLVPVPPHGDLIDLKAPFKAQYYDEMTEDWLEKIVTVEDALYGCMVDEMPPTIIPAEEGE